MVLFAATIGLSAFLLFLVQPIIAKQILPWFGGSAAVWTTCMVFFQLVLLLGYCYSDLVTRKLTARQQAWLHGSLLVASLAILPITPSAVFKPVDAGNPIGRILLLLTATIGPPYLMLSTTSPLVQAWFARRFDGTPKAASVWRLYALSNVASMLALLGYPTIIEPNATNRMQSLGWSLGYSVFVLLALASAWLAARPRLSTARSLEAAPHLNRPTLPMPMDSAVPALSDLAAAVVAPTARDRLMWLGLAALGSVLLLAVTNHITQNVAAIPFLWILPLATYLVTIILTFDGKGWYRRPCYLALTSILCVLMLAGLVFRINSDWEPSAGLTTLFMYGLLPVEHAAPLYALGLFVVCMFCHGELVARKPSPIHLTRFYLLVSIGGALGGCLVGIAAPLTLDTYWELPTALLAASVLALAMASPGMRPIALAGVAACGYFIYEYANKIGDDVVEQHRSFYGTLSVSVVGTEGAANARLRLLHGVIMHGEQYRYHPYRSLTTTYYGETSGIGQVIDALRVVDAAAPQRVGLIGLGVGTMVAYGRKGDVYRIYELNSAVLDLARRWFSYLRDSEAVVETLLGDARMVMESEEPQKFDVLAVDAFSGDAIPVHLLTREAMGVYRRHLREGGAVAFHITNRCIDLAPVTRQLADESGMQALLIIDEPPDDVPWYGSDWVIISSNARLIDELRGRKITRPIAPPEIRPWTDDYNNLFDVLK
jgi:hypothetical protein